VLAAISLLALGLRVWHLDYGLPGVFNMDERPILDRALTFAKGDPNPHNFLYPTLYLYAIFAWEALYFVVGRGLGWFSSLAAFQNAFFVDASGHVLAARLLTALLGAATVPAAYLFGRRVGGSGVGLAAALLLAVAPLAVRDAHYVKLDVPVTLLTTLALASLTRIAGEPEAAAPWRTWAAAGLLAGLAISTHYYAAILAVPFAAVAAADVSRSGRWQTSAELLIVAGLATIAGFVLGSPFFVLEPGVLVRDFTELRQVDIDRAVGSGLFSSIDTYGALLPKAMGWPTVVLGLVGILSMLWRDWRRALPLAVFPVAFMIFVANTFPASRYLNIVIPTGAVAAACGVAGLTRGPWRVSTSNRESRRKPRFSFSRTARRCDNRKTGCSRRCALTSAMRHAPRSSSGCNSLRRPTRRPRSACSISVKAVRQGACPAIRTRSTWHRARSPGAMALRCARRVSAWWC
jgi:hypothetical protein